MSEAYETSNDHIGFKAAEEEYHNETWESNVDDEQFNISTEGTGTGNEDGGESCNENTDFTENEEDEVPVPLNDYQRKQRLYLQLVISAVIIVVVAIILNISHAFIGISYYITHGASLVAMYTSITSYFHSYLHTLRIILEVLILFGVFFAFIHRIIGYLLGVYIRSLLDPEGTGQYTFNFDWISLRGGFDQNMLVISGFEWRNPSVYTNTPYLLRINEISFIIDIYSVYHAIMHNSAIKIHEIRLDKAHIYIEKLTQRSIDKASALAMKASSLNGVPDIDEQLGGSIYMFDSDNSSNTNSGTTTATTTTAVVEVLETAEVKITTTTTASAGSISTTPTKTQLTTTTTSIEPTSTSTVKSKKPKLPLQPGTLNLWAAMGATSPQQEASALSGITKRINNTMDGTTNMVQFLSAAAGKIDVRNAILKSAKNVSSSLERNFRKTFGTQKSNNSNSSKSNKLRSESNASIKSMNSDDLYQENDADNSDMQGFNANSSEHGTEISMEEALALLQSEYPDMVLPPLPQDTQDSDYCEDSEAYRGEHKTSATTATPTTPTSATTAAGKAKNKKDAWKGWGVPYKLEIDYLLLHDLQLHAQDYLNAEHSKQSKRSVIKLNTMGMVRTELTLSPDRNVGGKRRGIYLDDVVWRLINKLLSELLKKNSIAMMLLLSSAAANRTSSVVASASTRSGKLFNQAASTTTNTAKMAFSAVNSVLSGVSTTGTSNHNSSNTSTSTTTAAAALNVLNSTSADVSKGARSALHSVGQFVKRTTALKPN